MIKKRPILNFFILTASSMMLVLHMNAYATTPLKEEVKPITISVKDAISKKLKFSFNIFNTNINKPKSNKMMTLCNTMDDLLKYTNDINYQPTNSSNPFTKYVITKYNNNFFKNNSIIVICDSGTFLERKVTNVIVKNNELFITIERKNFVNTFAASYNHILVEVCKSDIKNVKKINYDFVDKK